MEVAAEANTRPDEASPAASDGSPNQRFPVALQRNGGIFADLAVSALLLLAVAAVFAQTVQFDFTDCDDPGYVTDNPHVRQGMTSEGIVWAFSYHNMPYWHPLTWFSHMLDCQVYGLDYPGGHHLTNVLLHGASTVLLFLLLRQTIYDLWASAFVAGLFAIHPLHVEAVAWVCERKDLLSGLFFMLTLIAYVRYARCPFSFSRYLLVTVLFGCGLMAKPILVTLPFVLLLLDYWPLDRFAVADRRGVRRIFVEKLPWLSLSVPCAFVAFLAQQELKGVVPLNLWPMSWRIGNAIVSYATYLFMFFWPTNLAVLYPRSVAGLNAWKVAAAFLSLVGISILAIVWRRKRPYLVVGWLWYLGMLVPVIGLVQVGATAMADRYTYLAQIGLYVALALGLKQALGPTHSRAWSVLFLSALGVLGVVAWRQTSYWRNTETLLRHTLACTSGNWQSHRTLAAWLEYRGKADEAIWHYERASEIDPMDVSTQNHIGVLLASRGRVEAAIAHFGKALELNPSDAEACNNIGLAFAHQGRTDLAITGFTKALAAKPDYAEAHDNLGTALLNLGQLDQAIAHFRAALEIKPDYQSARDHLAAALARQKGQ